MKKSKKLTRGLMVAALLLCGVSMAMAQTTNIVIDSFDASLNSEGLTPNGCSVMWGAGTILWDNSQLYPGTTGSAYVSAGFSTTDGSQSPVQDDICFTYDNWYYIDTNDVPSTIDFAKYSAVQFEIMWDTNFSTMSIDQFNNPALYQANLSGSTPGLGVGWIVPNGNFPFLAYTNIPDAASNGWVTITVPIPDSLSGTAGTVGIFFTKYIANESQLTTIPTANFWVANVQLLGTAAPPPPPTIQVPVKPTPGLNVFASTAGNGPYDRQQVSLLASNGVSWVSYATAANPVTYSFTIDGFPQNPATENACEAYMMMSPNPANYDKAIDYNEANCVMATLQQGNGSTMMTYQYKIDQPSSENLTTVGTVTNTGTALGTWSVTYTSPTNVTLTAPNGSTSSFIFTNGTSFAETQTTPGCILYLGMQANNTASLNQAVCYSKFSITGVPAAMSDNFLNDSALNTNLWFNSVATAPAGVFVMPPGALDWLTWSLPATGFQLQTANSLSGPWTTTSHDLILGEVGQDSQLITTNDVSTTKPNTFFRMANP